MNGSGPHSAWALANFPICLPTDDRTAHAWEMLFEGCLKKKFTEEGIKLH